MKKLLRFIPICIIFFLAANISSQWVTVSVSGKKLNAVTSPMNGYVYTVGDSGYVKASTNGGSQYAERPIGSNSNLYSVQSFSTNIVYVCGADGVIAKSTNSGVNWIGMQTVGVTNAYLDMDFINSTTGLVVGERRRFAWTANGGTNWITGQLNLPIAGNLNINCVKMIDNMVSHVATADTLIAGLYNSYIFKSTNNGTNYIQTYNVQSPTRNGFKELQFFNSNTGFAVCVNGTVLRTTNAGVNWTQQPAVFNTSVNAVYFADIQTGYAIGDNNVYKKTTNSGANWYLLTTGSSIPMNDLYFLNTTTGYAAGNGGFIIVTATGGGSFVGLEPAGSEIPNDFSLSQNYPNPFNPSTNISFDIPDASHVKLAIYSILGTEVKVATNEFLSAGKYNVNVDASDLPSGTYFYRLETGSFTQTRKMILIK